MTRHPRRRVRTVGALAALAALSAGACGGDQPAAEPDPAPVATETPTTTAAPTTTAPDVPPSSVPADQTPDEAGIRDVLHRYWVEGAISTDPPEPDRHELLRLLSPSMQAGERTIIQEYADKGQYARRPGGGPVPHSAMIKVDGDTAVARECVVNDVVVYDANGTVVDDDIVSHLFDTYLSRSGDTWVLTRRVELSTVPGSGMCSAS